MPTRQLAPEDALDRLRAQFGDNVTDTVVQHGHAVATVTPARYHDVIRSLRDEPDFACDYCDFTSAVDWGEEGMDIVTHLFSTQARHNVRIKVKLPADQLTLDTISDLYPTADWHERETTEMFGVTFTGHPQPVKLLLAEPFEGHPLRKDFPLMTREAKPWPGAVEGEEDEDE
ncbi:MAG: NADH-quinone oxidoreductase subunit C [Actinomycetota bacterium]